MAYPPSISTPLFIEIGQVVGAYPPSISTPLLLQIHRDILHILDETDLRAFFCRHYSPFPFFSPFRKKNA